MCGVQQGDPCGPLFFCLTLHPLVKELTQIPRLEQGWFIDDGYLFGGPDAVENAVDVILDKALNLGFFSTGLKAFTLHDAQTAAPEH